MDVNSSRTIRTKMVPKIRQSRLAWSPVNGPPFQKVRAVMMRKTMQITAAVAASSHWDRKSDQAPGVGIKPARQKATRNIPINRRNRRQLRLRGAATPDVALCITHQPRHFQVGQSDEWSVVFVRLQPPAPKIKLLPQRRKSGFGRVASPRRPRTARRAVPTADGDCFFKTRFAPLPQWAWDRIRKLL